MFVFIFLATPVKAGEKFAGASASVPKYGKCTLPVPKKTFLKAEVIKDFFANYNSPLANYTNTFISSCLRYELDCYFLPSIAAIESYYGKRYIKEFNNPFGWGGGYYKFKSLEEAINTVSERLKTRYVERGATNLKLIGKYYSADSSWWKKTTRVKNNLKNLEKQYSLFLKYHIVE